MPEQWTTILGTSVRVAGGWHKYTISITMATLRNTAALADVTRPRAVEQADRAVVQRCAKWRELETWVGYTRQGFERGAR